MKWSQSYSKGYPKWKPRTVRRSPWESRRHHQSNSRLMTSLLRKRRRNKVRQTRSAKVRVWICRTSAGTLSSRTVINSSKSLQSLMMMFKSQRRTVTLPPPWTSGGPMLLGCARRRPKRSERKRESRENRLQKTVMQSSTMASLSLYLKKSNQLWLKKVFQRKTIGMLCIPVFMTLLSTLNKTGSRNIRTKTSLTSVLWASSRSSSLKVLVMDLLGKSIRMRTNTGWDKNSSNTTVLLCKTKLARMARTTAETFNLWLKTNKSKIHFDDQMKEEMYRAV